MSEKQGTPPAMVRVSPDGSCIFVSDADPASRTLIRNARDVHKASAEMLAGPLTLPELRFLATTLRQCLGDVLAELDDAAGEVSDGGC